MSAAPTLQDEGSGGLRLLDLLLEEQEDLSAVERFAQRHAEAESPLQERYYRDLIPSSTPGAGEQYAFQVDLDACTGCKACVTACHNLNGLDPSETWRDVGLLVGVEDAGPVLQTVTTACHHCEDPGCLAGCPVQAYEKDPVTGIVRHLDDQCIGCQYCLLKCPYDVPQYDASRGIVRKCDMCSDRLSVGEAPACVQGCPNEAISIETVAVGTSPAAILPAAPGTVPDSGYTRPTTRYVGAAGRSALRPVDEAKATPADPHHPLSSMLVLSQLAVGAFAVESLLGPLGVEGGAMRVCLGLAATAFGLAGANLHLGRPWLAFRAVLGLRTSWMSREIVVLGAFAGAAAAAFAACVFPGPVGTTLAWLPLEPPLSVARLGARLSWVAAGTGAVAVACSVMIYVDTHRPSWRGFRTGPLFFGTTALLGLAVATVSGAFAGERAATVGLASGWALAAFGKLRFERGLWSARDASEEPSLARGRALLAGPLSGASRQRLRLAWLGGVAAPGVVVLAALGSLPAPVTGSLAALGLVLCACGEWLERHLYFRTSVPLAMPGS